jgi:Mycothiol maleylpyruvate isomerase N-terminal domain
MGIDVFLPAAESVRPLIAAPQVAAAWAEPSALRGMTVGGLTAHLVYAITSINAHPDKPVPETDPIDTVAYYVSGPDTDVVSDSVREAVSARSREQAQPGPAAVLADFDCALKRLGIWLPAQSPDRLMRVPIGRCMRLGDFLVVRLVEVLVHADDLAFSVDLPGPALAQDSSDALVALFLGMCRRRHGDWAVIRAFTRRERDAVDALRAF